jgi:sugar-specific transcriptional regulator TrmB
MTLDFLETLGLTQKESRLYEILLTEGELPISTLITRTKYKRATVYKSLYALESKGLATRKTVNKKIHFRPESPLVLSQLSTRRLQEMEGARADLANILPQLISQFTMSVERPVVTVYEGVNGLKKLYELMLIEKSPIEALLSTADIHPDLFAWLTSVFVKKRVSLKIPVRSIVTNDSWGDEYVRKNEKELRETRMISSRDFPIEVEIDVFGSKLAFISYRANRPLIGVIMDHQTIADSARSWFALAWLGTDQIPDSSAVATGRATK